MNFQFFSQTVLKILSLLRHLKVSCRLSLKYYLSYYLFLLSLYYLFLLSLLLSLFIICLLSLLFYLILDISIPGMYSSPVTFDELIKNFSNIAPRAALLFQNGDDLPLESAHYAFTHYLGEVTPNYRSEVDEAALIQVILI